MNATMRFIVWGTIPLGAILGGALGNVIGLHADDRGRRDRRADRVHPGDAVVGPPDRDDARAGRRRGRAGAGGRRRLTSRRSGTVLRCRHERRPADRGCRRRGPVARRDHPHPRGRRVGGHERGRQRGRPARGGPARPPRRGHHQHPDAARPLGPRIRATQAIREEFGEEVAVLVLSQYLEPDFAMRLLDESGRASATCSRTGSRTSTSCSTRPARGPGGPVHRSRRSSPVLIRRRRERRARRAHRARARGPPPHGGGRSNQAIATRLVPRRPKTVETHIALIFSKLALEPAATDHRRVLAVLAYLQAR